MKKSEVRRRAREKIKKTKSTMSKESEEEEEFEEDESMLEERDPITGLLYTRAELKKKMCFVDGEGTPSSLFITLLLNISLSLV